MSLRIHNTLTGAKEEFVPLQPGKAGMYVCGVTVYDLCHVGHARAGVVFDTIYRHLKHRGYDVTYVRNFTDIDDKIIKRALEENTPWTRVTEKYIAAFYEDMDRLNLERPTFEPKATEHIEDMLSLIEALIRQGKAYALEGDVYYAVKSFAGYGRLSGKNIDDLMAGARVDVDERKRDPLDFALWKKSKPGEPFWGSPWGQGRPGWHIECSAMSARFLGETFDLHGGGRDLIFPHHENEIAQSCGATGQPPVRIWIHNGFVNINKEKMSKSLGNFFSIRDILKIYHPEALRLFLLSSHYRSPIDFNDQSLDEAEKTLDRFYEFFAGAEKILGADRPASAPVLHPLDRKTAEAMDDDFNTAVALACMIEELRYLNALRSDLTQARETPAKRADLASGAEALRAAGRRLGLFYRDPEQYKSEQKSKKSAALNLDTEKIDALIAERTQARAAKDWARADRCRDDLVRMGVVLEDTAQGTLWKIK
jgi:cysteinyl-tRNA synthetase